jgi:hypothetical protein
MVLAKAQGQLYLTCFSTVSSDFFCTAVGEVWGSFIIYSFLMLEIL